jgi:probable F420-dependent oxidoreductase
MKLGVGVPVSGSWATPQTMRLVAKRAEDLGFASLWTFQRLLYPADPGPDATRWPPVYRSVHDPLMTLAYLAGQTSSIRLGVAVLNMPFYSPLTLAKQATTLDVVSGGRLDLGLGIGWSELEYAATRAPTDERGARAEEFLTMLDAIWTSDVVEVRGRFWELSGVRVEPRPVQQPRPGLLLGGHAPAALRRAGRLADGWVSSSGQDLAALPRAIETVRQGAAEAGKDPDGVRVVVRGVARVRPAGAERRRPLSGSYDEIRADLDTLRGHGVTETFLDLNFDRTIGAVDADPDDSARRALELLETLAPG